MIKALLRLVTIWFRYGETESVLIEVEAQLVNTPTKAWLMAIPQLIARLGTQHKELQGLLIDLLKNIASRYPHAIIWPLFTASQTNKIEHQEAAREVMNYICTMSDGTRLVTQAQTVGRELIRTSLSLTERYVIIYFSVCWVLIVKDGSRSSTSVSLETTSSKSLGRMFRPCGSETWLLYV